MYAGIIKQVTTTTSASSHPLSLGWLPELSQLTFISLMLVVVSLFAFACCASSTVVEIIRITATAARAAAALRIVVLMMAPLLHFGEEVGGDAEVGSVEQELGDLIDW